MRINFSFWKKKSSGSALIMTMIMLVNAVLIMSAATAISFRENKNSGVTKISAIALQGADSGLEWALEKKRSKADTETLTTVFENYQGLFLQKDNIISNVSIRLYFLNKDNKTLGSSSQLGEVYSIRSVSTVSAGGGIKVSRALQARVKED